MVEWFIVLTLIFNDGHTEQAQVPGVYATPLVCQKRALSKEFDKELIEQYKGKGIGLVQKNCEQRPVKFTES
jgi:hypothetical protein